MITPLRFFETAHQNFALALQNREKKAFFYRVVGLTFCLEFAGNEIAEKVISALAHLKIDSSEACDFTICIWDSVSTDTPPLEFPWPKGNQAFRGEVSGYNDSRFFTVVDIHTKVMHAVDHQRKLALYWIRDAADLPWWISGSPLQLVFHWWLSSAGYQLTHAAVVGIPGSGVLLAGKSGSGKSTTALACMRAGMHFVAEDYCLISDTPNIWAHSIYNSAKISPFTLKLFPELKHQVVNPDRKEGDKAFLFHHRFQPEKILAGVPLKALLALNIEPSEASWLEPVEPQRALGPLALTTLWQLTHTGPAVFKHLERVARQLPCYILHLGNNIAQIPQLIEKLL